MANFFAKIVKVFGLLLVAGGLISSLIFFHFSFSTPHMSEIFHADITPESTTNYEVQMFTTTKANKQRNQRIPDISGSENEPNTVEPKIPIKEPHFVTKLDPNLPILTGECGSRLGNQMFVYVTLLAISQWNNRTAYMSPIMDRYLSKYFKPSLPALTSEPYAATKWEKIELGPAIPENIHSLPQKSPTGSPSAIKFFCCVQAWRYFHHIRPQILQEFKFLPEINDRAQGIISKAKAAMYPEITPSEVTLIGIHVRRGDYVGIEKSNLGYLPDMKFYQSAMAYLRSKVKNPLYIVASNGIEWCKENFPNTKTGFMVHFLEGTSEDDGGHDLAVLTKSEHAIFGLGTFGFWAGYLVNGEVVYCSDCIHSESGWMKHPLTYRGDYIGNFIVPTWTGMSRHGTSKK